MAWYKALLDVNQEFAARLEDKVFTLMESEFLPHIQAVADGAIAYPMEKVPRQYLLFAMVSVDADNEGLCLQETLIAEKKKFESDHDWQVVEPYKLMEEAEAQKAAEPSGDENEAADLSSFERKFKTSIEKLKTEIATALHESLQQIGMLVAGKRGSKTQRDLGSCASGGYITLQYKGVL